MGGGAWRTVPLVFRCWAGAPGETFELGTNELDNGHPWNIVNAMLPRPISMNFRFATNQNTFESSISMTFGEMGLVLWTHGWPMCTLSIRNTNIKWQHFVIPKANNDVRLFAVNYIYSTNVYGSGTGIYIIIKM